MRTKFAPWVQDLNLIVEECSIAGAQLRLPYWARLTRVGDTICGRSLMACADSAMAIAIFSAFGGFRNVTTVSQTAAKAKEAGAMSSGPRPRAESSPWPIRPDP